jgi:hypothetical protein
MSLPSLTLSSLYSHVVIVHYSFGTTNCFAKRINECGRLGIRLRGAVQVFVVQLVYLAQLKSLPINNSVISAWWVFFIGTD